MQQQQQQELKDLGQLHPQQLAQGWALSTHSPLLQPQQQQQQSAGVPGEFPYSWFVAYPRLTHLRVVGCGAAGVLRGAPVAQAKHLASLVLSHNRLQGTLPDEVAGLKVRKYRGRRGQNHLGWTPMGGFDSMITMQHV
jgi:hypothetical protein